MSDTEMPHNIMKQKKVEIQICGCLLAIRTLACMESSNDSQTLQHPFFSFACLNNSKSANSRFTRFALSDPESESECTPSVTCDIFPFVFPLDWEEEVIVMLLDDAGVDVGSRCGIQLLLLFRHEKWYGSSQSSTENFVWGHPVRHIVFNDVWRFFKNQGRFLTKLRNFTSTMQSAEVQNMVGLLLHLKSNKVEMAVKVAALVQSCVFHFEFLGASSRFPTFWHTVRLYWIRVDNSLPPYP